jgi:PGF-pre-PGF domain-containing protein
VLIIDTTTPEKPALLSPIDEAILATPTPTFDWSDITDPSGFSYTLQISPDENFSFCLFEKTEISVSTYTLPSIEALVGGRYYWRVRAIDGATNSSDWSTGVFIIENLEILPLVTISKLEKNENFSIDFLRYNPEAPVSGVNVTATQEVTNVFIIIRTLEAREIEVEVPDVPSYYLRVTTSVPYEHLSAIIEFRVLRSWIEANHIDESTIRLLKSNGEGWENLPTKLVGSTSDYISFKAYTPELAPLFAVVGTAAPPPPPPTVFLVLLAVLVIGGFAAFYVYKNVYVSRRTRLFA